MDYNRKMNSTYNRRKKYQMSMEEKQEIKEAFELFDSESTGFVGKALDFSVIGRL